MTDVSCCTNTVHTLRCTPNRTTTHGPPQPSGHGLHLRCAISRPLFPHTRHALEPCVRRYMLGCHSGFWHGFTQARARHASRHSPAMLGRGMRVCVRRREELMDGMLSRVDVWRTMYTMFGDKTAQRILKKNVIACLVIKKHDNGMFLLDSGILVKTHRITFCLAVRCSYILYYTCRLKKGNAGY